MKFEFLKKKNNGNLLLIFGGWSTTPEFYKNLNSDNWDIAVVTSYSDFSFPLSFLDSYHTVGVIAWSMGVFAASKTLQTDKITFAIAVNGTDIPVSDLYGIPETIYTGTKLNLSERNLLKFRKRISGEKWEDYKNAFPQNDDIELLKNELEFIQNSLSINSTEDKTAISENKNHKKLKWNRAYISDNDKIFPPENQKRFWNNKNGETEIIEISSAHLPDFQKIIDGLLPSRNKIAKKFHKALPSYDSASSIQKEIAHYLVRLIEPVKFERILEIGPGTGYLTRLISEKTKPSSIDLIDLYPIEKYNIGIPENLIVADAEEWMVNETGTEQKKYDAIVSASAIQWFADPALFFKNCHTLLKDKGMLLISTFSYGNLKELKAINPYRLLYRNISELKEMLVPYFEIDIIEEKQYTIEFNNKRELLHHLVATGVGATPAPGYSIKELFQILPTRLTYTPVFIKAVKK